jgi:hypothetical protein
MKELLKTAGLILGLILGLSLFVCAQTPLDDLRDTLPVKASVSITDGMSVKFEIIKFEGCAVSWKSTYILNGAEQNASEISFLLSDIDPGKLKIDASDKRGLLLLEFHTVKDEKDINTHSILPGREKGALTQSAATVIYLRDRNYAEKALANFADSIKKCL